MNPKLNYFVDLGMLIAFLVVVTTGILKFPGIGSARNYMLLHDWAGIALALFVLLHLILHWKWIVAMTKQMLTIKK